VPIIKLRVDLRELDKYFPMNYTLPGGFEYYLKIDRLLHDEIQAILNKYGVADNLITQDFCFILLWVVKEIEAIDEQDNRAGDFQQMWAELDGLKEYLMKHRITSVRFEGESERGLPGESFSMTEMSNIDRLCDGIRSIYKDEFHHDKHKRRIRGQRAWKRRKMEIVRNNILNWMVSIPKLDPLELDEQNEIIEKLARLAGLPE
jgi:hypothetical protein